MTLWTKRTARKRHPCLRECGSPIEPGAVYVRGVLPPWTDPNYSEHWWTGAFHGRDVDDCPTYAGSAELTDRVAGALS